MLKKLFSYLSIISLALSATAQTYPVVSTTQIIPPYSVYLSDYASASSDKLIANLMLTDQNQSGIQVKLKITITGDNGVKLETKPEFLPPPITLYPNIPEQIKGIDLQSYLEPTNLNIIGLNFSQFMQSKKLPEGIYQFTVEAVEYRRNKTISNPGTAVGWLILNDPPIWNLPQHNTIITATNPQNIFFSWFPMHSGSPNAAFTTEYEFSLYDLIPQTANPDEYVNIAVPIHQSTSMNNSLVYGPAEIPLEPGRKYAARLRAYDTEGRDMFKNNGYSTVLVFTYGQECITPVGITHQDLTPHTANISWTAIPGNTEFELYYREKTEDPNAQWYLGTTSQTSATVNQLKPQHTYQYVLRALCGTITSEPTAVYEFTTPEKILDTLVCEGNTDIPEIDGSPPLENLYIGDIINVGGFEGIITQARGSNSVFSGKCIMRVTNFNILLKSHFTDIHINQSYQLTEGNVIADRESGILINLDDIINQFDSLANISSDSIISNPEDFINELDSSLFIIDPLSINDSLADDIEEIIVNTSSVVNSGNISPEDEDALNELIDEMYEILIQSGYISGGGIAKVDISFPATIPLTKIDKNTLTECQYYPTYDTLYSKIKGAEWIYLDQYSTVNNILAKVYPKKTTDSLIILPTDTTIVNVSIPTVDVNKYNFNLTSLVDSDTTSYVTMLEDSISGKEVNAFNIITNKIKNVDLYIYLLQDSAKSNPPSINISDIQNIMDQIYGNINVNFNLILDTVKVNYHLDFDLNGNNELDKSNSPTGESFSLMRVSPDSLTNIYRLFVIDIKITRPGLTSNQKIGGYSNTNSSPFGVNIYPAVVSTYNLPSGGEATTFEEDVAHEIGHQVFGLRHPFDDYGSIGFAHGTDWYNIMDYPTVITTKSKRQLRAYQVIFIEKSK